MAISPEQVAARAAAMQDAFVEAARRNEWEWIADAFYARDCEYLCEYGGAMRVHARGRDEIRATHYGRDMLVGWEGWSFPIERYATHGNRIITHWWNRGPGTRPDGSHYQTPGVSFITVGDDGLFTWQLDLFDLAYERELDSDDPRIGFPLVNLANIRSMQGKVDGVEAMYRRHLALQQKVYGPNHSRVWLALHNLGDFLSKTGRYDEAIPMLRRALDVFSSSLGPEHPNVAVALSALGDAELASGRPRQARDHYRRSVTVRERSLEQGQFDAFFAYALVRLGGIEAELGDEAAAERNLNRAAAILRDAPDGVDAQLAPALLDLGRWLAERQRCDEAAPLLQRVVQIRAARQSPPSAAATEPERILAACGVEPPTPAAG